MNKGIRFPPAIRAPFAAFPVLFLAGRFAFGNFFIQLGNFRGHQLATVRRQRANALFPVLAGVDRRQHFDNHQTVIQAIELNLILRFLNAFTTSAMVPCAFVRLLRSISRFPVNQ